MISFERDICSSLDGDADDVDAHHDGDVGRGGEDKMFENMSATFLDSSSSSVLSVPSETVLFLLLDFGANSELLKNQFVGRI